jgi:multidrug resistance efflux pump
LSRGHCWRRRLVLAALCLLSGAMFLPLHYHVDCKCRLQPVVRRFVTAPFDGTLEKSLAEPGDIVAEGQTLARMDGREVRWEASGLEADRNRAEVKRNTSLAKHEMGAARMAGLEAQRLDLKLRLLERRADHLEIKSPIRGVIIGGDLKRVEGMPVTVGQGLFEVAPLDQMVFELAIPEREFAHVAVGQEVTLRLDAFPRKTWQGSIAKIYPRAEARDSEQVFVAELAVGGANESLRPGMNGKATVVAQRHSLAWILFHRPWQHLQEALGW